MSTLNASAPEFQPNLDNRCLFLTFSNGFPVTENQVFAFFDRMYPSCVELLYVYRPRGAAKPGLFGKVRFKSHLIPEAVMGPYERVCFSIGGRPMYCRRFVSDRPRTGNAAAPALRDRP